MKKILLSVCVILYAAASQAQKSSMREYVDQLMRKMTLHEKIGQLNLMVAGDITTGGVMDTRVGGDIAAGNIGGVFNIKGIDKIRAIQDIAVKKSRLGIPLIVGMDVIHGYETIFPIPLAMSCSWDMEAIERSAMIAAKECSADGINWTFSPMTDIALDARWGRISEGGGEDPFLGSRIAEAMVRGYQGDYSKPYNIMACLKHFALYGAVEAGRDYNTVDMSRIRMYNRYFPPYKAAVDAGVGSVMSSFNIVDGEHATANRWLLTDLLRDQWNFDGFVVTDYESIGEMTKHGFAPLAESSVMALRAGTDMDMCSRGFVGTLEKSLKEGLVTIEEIDLACRRVLEAKYKLGLFADPYKYLDKKRAKKDIFTAENRKAARDIAAETFVLLKNEGNLLPLKKQGKIALIGPLANTRSNITGTWCVAQTPERYSTLKDGMERAVGDKAVVLYAQGCNISRDEAFQRDSEFGRTIERGDEKQLKAEAVQVAGMADVIVCAMGECSEMSGESSSRANLDLPDVQMELLKELVALGKPVVLLNFSGRPTVMKWEDDNVQAILNVWFGGSEAADAIADVVFGDKVPCGRLTATMPQAVGQLPLYYNHLNTGRPVPEGANKYYKYRSNYLDMRNDPLYPFGYGLSYTTFSYSDLQLSSNTMAADGDVKVSVMVTNTGGRDAAEVVQLYIRDVFASIARPVKELKGFERIELKAGESRRVEFTVTPDLLKFYNRNLDFVLEPGDFEIMVGPNSRDLKKLKLTVK
ncbi:beta-glucosidase BglX [Xylanibacter muris]|uniref:Beta-glucosidase BglX n=1 Tax=Xylanibacter muris TaxID=2736290 RepID=A0ABX2AMB5_9BACT|nr:beta-glucosidase BglX [Xylanibacter muris]NPD91076.1 beta-glucosidase BglX [Xylanibacter muris]